MAMANKVGVEVAAFLSLKGLLRELMLEVWTCVRACVRERACACECVRVCE